MNVRLSSAAFSIGLLFFSASYSDAANATTPIIDNQLPPTGLAGEQVCFDSTFTHTGAPGFGPYLQIITDPELSFDSASLFGSGQNVTTVGVFPSTPPFELEDPLSEQMVTGLPGQTFSLVTKAVGSVVSNGPELTTELCATIQSSAAIGTPLNLSIRPAYRFGNSSTGANGPILGSLVNQTITPQLYEYEFSTALAEQEIAPTLSGAVPFFHSLNVADGSTIFSPNISQVLNPEMIASTSATVVGGNACSLSSEPTIGVNGGNLELDCASATGGSSLEDLTVRYNAIVDNVLDPTSCATLPIMHVGESDAQFPSGTPLSTLTNNAMFEAKHITLRQEISDTQIIPGQTYTITNFIQVSDFADPRADQMLITDTLDDGLSFNSVGTLSVNGGAPTVYTPTVTSNADGTQSVAYDLNDAGLDIAPGDRIQISYSIQAEQSYRQTSAQVLANDNLGATSELVYGLTAGASACSEGSSSSALVSPINIQKTIIGGATDFDPGESIGFRLRIDIPSGDVPAFSVTDFLPLAVFSASDISTNFGDNITFGPADTLAQTPTISIDAPTNAVILSFPALVDISGEVIELDLSTTISTDPYADGLTLTNILQSNSANTSGEPSVLFDPASFNAKAPVLEGVMSQVLPTVKDAGDTVQYTLILTNTGSADAFDVMVDVPATSGLETASLVGVTINGVVASTSGSFAGGDFTITGPVAPGEVIDLQFDRVISDDVIPLQNIISTASTSWANASSASPFPDISTEAAFTVDNLSIVTTVNSVSPEGSTGNVVVGDTVSYITEVTLPESEIEDFNIDLVLPAGFNFVDGSLNLDTSAYVGTIDTSPTASMPVLVNNQQSLEIAFSGTTSTSSDNITTNNRFTLSFDAIVADDAANEGIISVQNKALLSSADFTGRTGMTPESTAVSTFAEHNLAVSTQATNADGETGGFEAGDLVTIEVTISNTGTAPAYDVVFDSLVNSELFDLTTVMEGTTPAPYTYNYSSPTVSYLGSNVTLNPGDDIVFSYTAIVRDDVRSGSNFTVTSNATGSSLDGMPALERVNTQTNDIILNSQSPTIGNLQVISSSEAWSGTATRDVFAIGEVVTYQFEATLPEGVTGADPSKSLLFVQLPRGFQYQDASALIRADFNTSLNSAVEGSLNPTNTPITPTVNGRRLSFDLGDITNNDDDADEEKIFITFDLLVLNQRFNNRGNRKNVRADITFVNQSSVTQSNSTRARSFIGEPQLQLDYAVSPSSVSGSSNVIFEAELTNGASNTSLRAWEFELVQSLPNELTPATLPVLSAVLSRGNQDISACAALSGRIVTVDSSCLAASEAYLDAGETIRVQLEAQVDPLIRFGQSATASASAIASSLPGLQGSADATPGMPNSDTGERTGERLANTSNEAVNDYFVVDTAFVIAETPNITLSLSDDQLQIGEVLTITQQIALPAGTTDEFVATLDLPDGLVYENTPIRIALPASDFSTSIMPNTTPGASTDPISLDFGSVVNSASDSQVVSVEIDVRVDNIQSNQNGSILPTVATLDYADILSATPSDSAELQVIEANIELTQTVISGAVDADAGDAITYRTVISNTSSQATAYQLAFADIFDPQLLGAPDGSGAGASFINISVANSGNEVVLSGSGSPISDSNFTQTTTNNADDTLSLNGTMDIPPGASISIEYTVAVSNTATAGASLLNSAAVTYTSDAAGAGRDASDPGSDDDNNSQLNNYNETFTSTIVLADDLAIQSALNAIHQNNDFVPGESVFIDIRLDVSEGQALDTEISNALPAGLAFIGANVNAGSNISYTGDVSGVVDSNNMVLFDFDTLTNVADNDPSNDFLVLTLEAQVLDIPSNLAGSVLSNSASASDLGNTVGPTSLDIDIVEPSVVASISTARDILTLGDTASFTVDIRATEFSADAFDTVFEIVVPSGFTYEMGSLVGPGIIDDSDPTRLVVDLGALSADNGVSSFIFNAQLNNDAPIGADFEFGIENGVHSSQPGAADEERSYSFSDSFIVASDDASFIDATQSLSILNDVNGNGVADPGDELGKTVLITNNGPRVDGVSFIEAFPANTTYVASSLTSTKGTVDDSSDASVDIGELASGESLTINFSIVVDAGTPPGTLIQAQGVVNSDSTIPELTDADGNDSNGDQANEIRVGSSSALTPALSVSQSINLVTDTNNDNAVSATDVLQVNYVLSNTDNTDLTNITLSDLLPAGLSYIPNSITLSGPTDPADSAVVSAGDIDVLIATLAANETLSINLQASIDGPLIDTDSNANTEVFTAQASVVSDQTVPVLADSNGNLADGAQPASITAIASGVSPEPDIEVAQSYVLINDVDGDGLADPGDTIQLVTSITNRGATTANLVNAEQSIPADTSLVPGSEQTSKGVTTNPGAGQFNANIGAIAPGETVITRFDVVIDAVASDTVLSSQQTVRGSNISDTLSDANANLNDGATPTLIGVFVSGTPQYLVSTSLSNTSDASTNANEFIQGERLRLELDTTFPEGLTRDGELSFTLPSGFSYEANTAQLKRVFDSAISAGLDPANINSVVSDTFVDVEVTVSGNMITLDLGNVISSDGDADLAGFVLALDLNTDAVVPSAQNQSFTVESKLAYNNDALVEQNVQSNDVDVVLLNRVPVASPDALSVDEDSAAVMITPLDNDTDPDVGQSLMLVSAGPASAGGTLVLNTMTGAIQYTPAPDFFGTETISYIVSDSAGALSTATITVTVNPLPDAPVANADTASTTENTPVTIDVLSNDVDADGDTLSVNSASSQQGSVVVNPDGSLSFTPNPGFTGAASIIYEISDGNGGTATGTVAVNVANVNDAPIVNGQSLTTAEDTPIVFNPLQGATDADGDTLSTTNLVASSGTVTLNPDGTINFVPDPDFSGPVTITYDVTDGNGGLVSVTTTIDVTPVNDLPIANEDIVAMDVGQTSINITPLTNDEDADGDTLSLTSASSDDGVLTVNTDGSVIFTPNPDFDGVATILYEISDGNGGTATGTILVNVSGGNLDPIVSGQSLTTPEDTSIIFDPLLGASDPNGDELSVSNVVSSSGTATLNPDGTINFVPEQDFNGTVTLTYDVEDGEGGLVSVTTTIEVTPLNDPPIANDDFIELDADQTNITIDPLVNDEDPDGDQLSLINASALIGSVEIVDGKLVYMPVSGFTGNDLIEYLIEDEDGEQATASILISVGNDGSGLSPVLSPPQDITIDATGLFTRVNLGVAQAVDQFGNALSVSIIDGSILFPPGINTVFYVTEDSEGRRTVVTQTVNVNPLVSIQNDQSVIEGTRVRVSVHLNGSAPSYPLTVPFSVSGIANSQDHDLINGTVTFNNSSDAFIEFNTFDDSLIEGVEELVITLSDSVNRGPNFEHVVSIVESNIEPEISLFVTQANEQRNLIAANEGLVTLNTLIEHPNPNNEYVFDWQNAEGVFDDLDDDAQTFTFDPATAAPGIYTFTVSITDADDPNFSDTEIIHLQIVERLPELGDGDTDSDGISDDEEGFSDGDGDFVFDYLDLTPECNVLVQEVNVTERFLIEAEAGACLRIGQYALGTPSGGALVYESAIGSIPNLSVDTLATSVGGINDFIAYDLPASDESVFITIPQRRPIPENAVYRVFDGVDAWKLFDESGNNALFSAPGELGVCPPPGSNLYVPGLVTGSYCVKLEIADGGENDLDGLTNAAISNTGFVGVIDEALLPTAVADMVTTISGEEISIKALDNDNNPAQGELMIISAQAQFGEVLIVTGEQGDEILFIPAPGFSGLDTITYSIIDSNGLTDVAVIEVNVKANLPPIAVDDELRLNATGSAVIDVLSNDLDPEGGNLQIVSATSTDGNVRVLENGTLEFTSNDPSILSAVITYTIEDDRGFIARAEVRITIEIETVRIRNESSGGSLSTYILFLLLITSFGRRYLRQERISFMRAFTGVLKQRVSSNTGS